MYDEQSTTYHKKNKTNEAVGVHQSSLTGRAVLPASPLKKVSKYRYIDTKFWDDSYIIDLIPTEKLLFLYLLTSPLTNIAGIYEIALRRMIFDTGIGLEEIRNILQKFQNDKKIYYIDGWIIICNFPKYQQCEKSPKIKDGIKAIIAILPSKIKERIDTLSIPYTYPLNYSNLNLNLNLNRDSNGESNIIPYREIINDLNSLLKTSYKHTTPKTRLLIRGRWNEGFRLDDFKRVHRIKYKEWGEDEKMNKYLRPSTLYGTKFENYLNQPKRDDRFSKSEEEEIMREFREKHYGTKKGR